MHVSRRRLLVASSVGALGTATGLPASETRSSKKTVAFLATQIYRHSHAQHILDRLTAGYAWGGKWQTPRVKVASVYIDQVPERDLSAQRIEKHDLRQFRFITEALTLKGRKLAVDGVVIIAEHGDYPRNDKGQKLYPRHKWFKQVVRVFEDSGRSVPVFSDKHLSTDWGECVEMVEDAERLKFPLMAGSSLPVTRRMPSVDMPFNAELKESVCVAYGGIDSYDIHALETAQCMSERRRGGEVGVKSVHAMRGKAVWKTLDADDYRTTRQLVVAALNRSHNLPVEGGFPTAAVTYEWTKQTFQHDVTAYFIEHRDGFRTTMVLTQIREFNYAGYLASGEIISCQMYLPMPGHGSTAADFFNPLTRHIEDLVLNRKANYPVQRTQLCSGMVIAGIESLHLGEKRVETPALKVGYQGPQESTYWRE